ncbi:MAG: hypothetical protein H7308_08820 [Chthonomonadaceae bacterium]|nr:hypothetical protein [Chthonomonadaceae bacterium]
METLILPPVGDLYADANTVIYSVQQHLIYAHLLASLWFSLTLGAASER